jgi:hypothetical protein
MKLFLFSSPLTHFSAYSVQRKRRRVKRTLRKEVVKTYRRLRDAMRRDFARHMSAADSAATYTAAPLTKAMRRRQAAAATTRRVAIEWLAEIETLRRGVGIAAAALTAKTAATAATAATAGFSNSRTYLNRGRDAVEPSPLPCTWRSESVEGVGDVDVTATGFSVPPTETSPSLSPSPSQTQSQTQTPYRWPPLRQRKQLTSTSASTRYTSTTMNSLSPAQVEGMKRSRSRRRRRRSRREKACTGSGGDGGGVDGGGGDMNVLHVDNSENVPPPMPTHERF